ncbi:MAG TPA: hypothetical protein VIH90_06735 [Candidatus Saccharimonadales bacterium]
MMPSYLPLMTSSSILRNKGRMSGSLAEPSSLRMSFSSSDTPSCPTTRSKQSAIWSSFDFTCLVSSVVDLRAYKT